MVLASKKRYVAKLSVEEKDPATSKTAAAMGVGKPASEKAKSTKNDKPWRINMVVKSKKDNDRAEEVELPKEPPAKPWRINMKAKVPNC